MLLTALMAVCSLTATAQDKLQEFINNIPLTGTRASNGFTDVDLSQFPASELERTTTLKVTDGRKVRFIKGTLTKAASLKGPILKISTRAQVDFGSPDNVYNNGGSIYDDIDDGIESVRMEGGSLFVSKCGSIGANKYAILLTSDDDCFELRGGTLLGAYIDCTAENASLKLTSGMLGHVARIKTKSDLYLSIDHGSLNIFIELLTKECKVYSSTDFAKSSLGPHLIKAPYKTYGDVIVEGYDGLTLDDTILGKIKFDSEEEGKFQLYLNTKKNTIELCIDQLQAFIDNILNGGDDGQGGDGSEANPYQANIPCSGIEMDDDVDFKEDPLQWVVNGIPTDNNSNSKPNKTTVANTTPPFEVEDCQGTLTNNGGNIYIRPGTTVTITNIYYQGCGCDKYIYVWGTLIIDINIYIYNVTRFIHLMPGGHVVIRGLYGEVVNEIIYIEGGEVTYYGGETSGGIYGWYNPGGAIHIYDGIIKGGTCGGWTGAGGISYIHNGSIYGGIINYGTTYIYGGAISGGSTYTIRNYPGGSIYIYGGALTGSGTIWNQGDIYIDGSGGIKCSDIYLVRGCHIYIIARLKFILRFKITIDNIILNEPIILGGKGYTLTDADIANIRIELPKGYAWKYDPTCKGIIIYLIDGITDAQNEQPTAVSTYDATGRQIGEARRGINILRMSDGTVKKNVMK